MDCYLKLSSLQHITIVHLSAQMCNHFEIKKRILSPLILFGNQDCCCPWEIQTSNKSYHHCAEKDRHIIKIKWKNIQASLSEIMKCFNYPSYLKQKLILMIKRMSQQMIDWVGYLIRKLGFHQKYILHYFKFFYWTSQGILDKVKTIKNIVDNENIYTYDRYALACFCCIEFDMSIFNDKLTPNSLHSYTSCCENFIIFWTKFMKMDQRCISKHINLLRSGFNLAIHCNNDLAVRCIWSKLPSKEKKAILFHSNIFGFEQNYVDILCFLLSNTNEDERIAYLEACGRQRNKILYALECLLKWPYQPIFMQTLKYAWHLLDYNDYASILLQITNHIGEPDFDYHDTWKQMWEITSVQFKKSILNTDSGKELFIHLFCLDDFQSFGEKNINLILKYSNVQQENYFNSEEASSICFLLVYLDKWDLLKRFVNIFYFSQNDKIRLLRDMISIPNGKFIIRFYLFHKHKLKLINGGINMFVCSPEDQRRLKKSILYSINRDKWFTSLIYENDFQTLEQYAKSCLETEEKISHFRKSLLFGVGYNDICFYLLKMDKYEILDNFLNWCQFSESELKNYKRTFLLQYCSAFSSYINKEKWTTFEQNLKWLTMPEMNKTELDLEIKVICTKILGILSLLISIDKYSDHFFKGAVIKKWIMSSGFYNLNIENKDFSEKAKNLLNLHKTLRDEAWAEVERIIKITFIGSQLEIEKIISAVTGVKIKTNEDNTETQMQVKYEQYYKRKKKNGDYFNILNSSIIQKHLIKNSKPVKSTKSFFMKLSNCVLI